MLQYLPLFAKDGIDVERVELPSGLFSRWRLFSRCQEFDVVIHQKRLLPAWQQRMLRRRARKLVYDFDDPMIYTREGDTVQLSGTRVKRFRETLSLADAVVVNHAGTESLAREYGARAVHVIPTPVDLSRWSPKESWNTEELTFGWSGTASNLPVLESIKGALQGRRLKLIADRPVELRGVKVEFIPWTVESEPAGVRSFDVALAPLLDDPWSRAKMPYKILTYFAAGVPVVASRLGAVESVIRDGENGLLAGDWSEQFARLENVKFRERVGRAGRASVEKDFSLEVCFGRLKALLESLTR